MSEDTQIKSLVEELKVIQNLKVDKVTNNNRYLVKPYPAGIECDQPWSPV
jgi:hypothetical protein